MPDLGSTSFSQTDSSNTPAGSDAPNTLDNNIRANMGAVTREWNHRSYTVTAGGTADAKTLTYSVAPDAYRNGQKFAFIANTTNTGSCSLNVNSLGAKTIKRVIAGTLTALSASDMVAGMFVDVAYNASDDSFVWVNYAPSFTAPSSATDSAEGLVELATTTETLTGTDTGRAVTPNALAALWEQGSNVASDTTISLGEGGYFLITGTTTITDIDFATDKAGRVAWVRFDGALTLTHGAALILPGAANITTAAGDVACFVSEGSDVVRCTVYTKANGQPLTSSGGTTLLGTITTTSGTENSLTGLTLTSYKYLLLVFVGVSNGTETRSYRVSATSGTNQVRVSPDFAAADGARGIVTIDLTDGTFAATIAAAATTASAATTAYAGDTTITTASTAVYVTLNASGSFDAGSIRVYGVS
jgi:hypothetical protein